VPVLLLDFLPPPFPSLVAVTSDTTS